MAAELQRMPASERPLLDGNRVRPMRHKRAPDLNLYYPGDPKTPLVFAVCFKQPMTLPAIANRNAPAARPGCRSFEGSRGHERTRRDSSRITFQPGEIRIRFEGGAFLELIDLFESE
jgi:hypothetical protein